MKKIKSYIPVLSKVALIVVIFFSLFLLNHSVMVSPDDYVYSFVMGSSNSQRVTSLSACISTGRYFYNNWTGRVIPHVLVGIFRNINSYIFEIVNSFVFIIFIIFISKTLNKKASFFSILFVFGYFAFSKMFGEKFAWVSGACNYLWPCTFLCIFIYYFYNYFIGQKNLKSINLILFSLYSFITGFMHENTAFVGGAFLIVLVAANLKRFLKFETKKKIFIIVIVLMFGLGSLLNIFAPGNLIRMNTDGSSFSLSFLQNYKDSSKLLIFIFLTMLLTFIIKNKDNILSKKNIKQWNYDEIKIQFLYFILPALIATIPMAFISYFPPRAFLAYELMFAIVLARNVNILVEYLLERKFKKVKYLNLVSVNELLLSFLAVFFTLVIFGHFSPSTLAQINYIIPYKKAFTSECEEALKNGEKDVIVSAFDYMNWIHREDYINVDNFFPELNYKMPVNSVICQYYGFERLTAVSYNDYLIEINVDTEGINPYDVIDKTTGENIYKMEYDNQIRYTIPKDKLGIYVLDCTKNGLKDKILSFRVRFVGGDITDKVSIKELCN